MNTDLSSPEILAVVDPDLFDLAESYLEKRKADLKNIPNLIEMNAYDVIENTGHKMLGNADLFGLSWLAQAGGELETSAKARESEKILALTEKLLRQLHLVKFVLGKEVS